MKQPESKSSPSKPNKTNDQPEHNRSILWVPWKGEYVIGPKSTIKCILCGARDHNPQVKIYELYRDTKFMILLNLYPYNPGHLLIAPLRHIENIEDLTKTESEKLFPLIQRSITLLKAVYNPQGFNVGFNIGRSSGASIPHLHAHIVPRYVGDQGFMETIGMVRVAIEDLDTTLKKLRTKISLLQASSEEEQ